MTNLMKKKKSILHRLLEIFGNISHLKYRQKFVFVSFILFYSFILTREQVLSPYYRFHYVLLENRRF